MGAFVNFLKAVGIWNDEEGTVFGGKQGNGVKNKVTFIAAYKPIVPQPPVPHGEGKTGHYPAYLGKLLDRAHGYLYPDENIYWALGPALRPALQHAY